MLPEGLLALMFSKYIFCPFTVFLIFSIISSFNLFPVACLSIKFPLFNKDKEKSVIVK